MIIDSLTGQPETAVRVDELFSAALDMPTGEREAFLENVGPFDQPLVAAVARLLRAADNSLLASGGAQKGKLWRDLAEDVSGEHPLRPGELVGPYRVEREIGRGGMAVVYSAERADGQFKQQVALKLVKRGVDSAEVVRRFEQERQILASLNHPSIARLVDGGMTADGRPFFAMEPVDGCPVDSYCDQHRLAVEERLRYFLEVASAVRYAHGNLVVHRDLKPSNILVTVDGLVKLLDFGIAKLVKENGASATAPSTRTGARIMTPEYASPEQVRGKTVSTASDVYQLGLLLYELLTGRRPFNLSSATPVEVERTICEQEPPQPSTMVARGHATRPRAEEVSRARSCRPERLRKRLQGDLDTIVMKALRKEPERRYRSVEELSRDVESHLGGRPVSARKDTLWYRTRKLLSRHTFGVLTSAAVVLLVSGLIGFYTLRLARERERAQLEAEKATQVSDFLKNVFAVSAPDRPKGGEITARELLDRGQQRITGELDRQPEVQAEMMVVLASVYEALGMYDQAGALFEQALEIQDRHLGADHLVVASTVSSLANLYLRQGKCNDAEPLYERSIAILEKQNLEDGKLATELGNLYLQRRKYNEAEQFLRRGLDAHRSSLGPESPEVAESLFCLGNLYISRNMSEQSIPLYKQALEIRERRFGPNHRLVAESLSMLGVAYSSQRRFDQAELFSGRALTVLETALGEHHPEVASLALDLGWSHLKAGRYDLGISYLRRALAAREEHFGPDHPHVANTLRSLSVGFQLQDRLDEAESHLRRALAIGEGTFEPNELFLANIYSTLAMVVGSQGKLPEARSLLERTLTILEHHQKLNDRQAARPLNLLAVYSNLQGKYDAGISFSKRAVEIVEEADGASDSYVGLLLDTLATSYEGRGDIIEAEPLLRRGFGLVEDHFGPGHSLSCEVRHNLARLCTKLGKLDEAGELYRKNLEAVKISLAEQVGDHSLQVAQASTLDGMGDLHQVLGSSAEAHAARLAAIAVTGELVKASGDINVHCLHAMVLLKLDRLAEAGPFVEKVLATGWRKPELLELCARHGLSQNEGSVTSSASRPL